MPTKDRVVQIVQSDIRNSYQARYLGNYNLGTKLFPICLVRIKASSLIAAVELVLGTAVCAF